MVRPGYEAGNRKSYIVHSYIGPFCVYQQITHVWHYFHHLAAPFLN
jgi:hypothetical protein